MILKTCCNFTCVIMLSCTYVGGPQHNPPTDEKATNPAYDTITDDHSKKPVEKPIGYYEDVIIPTQVKMTPNPAYAVP